MCPSVAVSIALKSSSLASGDMRPGELGSQRIQFFWKEAPEVRGSLHSFNAYFCV